MCRAFLLNSLCAYVDISEQVRCKQFLFFLIGNYKNNAYYCK